MATNCDAPLDEARGFRGEGAATRTNAAGAKAGPPRIGSLADQPRSNACTTYADKLAGFLERHEYPCLILLLLSYFLAVHHSGASKPLWFDEVGTLTVATEPTLHKMFVAAGPDGQPPLQYLAVRAVLHLFPYSEFVLRLPALLCMLLAFVALYFFLRKFCPAIVALLGLSIFITPDIIHFGEEARPYSFMVGFTALLLLCWQRAAEAERRPFWLAGVTLSTACLVLSQPYGCFYVVPVLAAEAYRSRVRRRLDGGLLIALALGLAAIAVTLWSAHATRVALFAGLPKGGIPFARPKSGNVYHDLLHELGDYGGLFLWMGLLGLPLGLRAGRPTRPPGEAGVSYRSSVVAIVTVILTCPVIWIFASVTTHYFWERYVLASTIGVIGGITLLVNRIPQRNLIAGGFLVGILVPWFHKAVREKIPRPAVIDPVLLKLAPGTEPIVYGDALDYPVVWHYASRELRARLVLLRDRQRMMTGSIDWMPDITMDAHADRGTYPMPVEGFDRFVANTPQFLFYSSGKEPDRNWALGALRAQGKHVDEVATGEFENAVTHLYRVH